MSLSKFGKVKVARSHEECRAIICSVCSKKVKQNRSSIRFVSEKQANLLRKFVFAGYNVNNTMYPTGICDSCRVTLTAIDKVCTNKSVAKIYIKLIL